MEIKIIKTEAQNERAIKEIEKLMSKEKLTQAEDDRLELLYVLVENFERKAYPVPSPDPVEAIKFYMDERGFSKADLVKQLGDRSKASQVLNRKRGLSLTMIRNLVDHWNMPADALLSPYSLNNTRKAARKIARQRAVTA